MRLLAAILLAFTICVHADEPKPCTAPSKESAKAAAKTVAKRHREFVKVIGGIAVREPFLYSDESFKDFQTWTLRYQRYATKGETLDYRKLFLKPASSVKMSELVSLYTKYRALTHKLSVEIVPHLEEHMSMIQDPVDRADYVRRYHESVDSLFTPGPFELKRYKIFNCDYTSQPLNTLWFAVNATVLIDQYALAIYGCKWLEIRDTQGLGPPPDFGTIREKLHKTVEVDAPGGLQPKKGIQLPADPGTSG